MNDALDRLARTVALQDPAHEELRYAFGHACVERVAHLLEDPGVIRCLGSLGRYVRGEIARDELRMAAEEAARLANTHQGSKSIDGCGHAAVSATYAVANALAGKAVSAAEYAAYATVYAQGGSAAVADRDSFRPEFEWQVRELEALVSQYA